MSIGCLTHGGPRVGEAKVSQIGLAEVQMQSFWCFVFHEGIAGITLSIVPSQSSIRHLRLSSIFLKTLMGCLFGFQTIFIIPPSPHEALAEIIFNQSNEKLRDFYESKQETLEHNSIPTQLQYLIFKSKKTISRHALKRETSILLISWEST